MNHPYDTSTTMIETIVHDGDGRSISSASVDSPIVLKQRRSRSRSALTQGNANRNVAGKADSKDASAGSGGGAFASLQKYLESCHDGSSESDTDHARHEEGNRNNATVSRGRPTVSIPVDHVNVRMSPCMDGQNISGVQNGDANDSFQREAPQNLSQEDAFQGSSCNAVSSNGRVPQDSPKQISPKKAYLYRSSNVQKRNNSFLTQFKRTKRKEQESSMKNSQTNSHTDAFEDDFESRLPYTTKKRMISNPSKFQQTAPSASLSQNLSFSKRSISHLDKNNIGIGTPHWGIRPRDDSSNSKSISHQRSISQLTSSSHNKTLMTRAQQLAAATKSSTMIGARSRRKAPNSSITKKQSQVSDQISSSSVLSTPWPKFDKQHQNKNRNSTPQTTSIEQKTGGDVGDGGTIEDDEASFGPNFLRNKKRKRPIADTVVEDDDTTTSRDILHFGESINRRNRLSSIDSVEQNRSKDRLYQYTDLQKDAIFATPRPSRQRTDTGTSSAPHSFEKSPHSGNAPGSNHSLAHSPQPQRRKKKNGPLSRMLQSIRGAIEADWVRFGTYPYRPQAERNRDTNDPRNRAESFMDVTILGEPLQIGAQASSPSASTLPTNAFGTSRPLYSSDKVVVKGFIHAFVLNEGRVNTIRIPTRRRRTQRLQFRKEANAAEDLGSNSNGPESSNATSCTTSPDALKLLNTIPSYAWLSFTKETFTELAIHDRKQIRIYNAKTIDITSFSLSSEGYYPFVACTRLCEVYPKELPSLSVPND